MVPFSVVLVDTYPSAWSKFAVSMRSYLGHTLKVTPVNTLLLPSATCKYQAVKTSGTMYDAPPLPSVHPSDTSLRPQSAPSRDTPNARQHSSTQRIRQTASPGPSAPSCRQNF